MIFIITILLLAADFYYLKNIAGRRLVGLRWWNEVDAQTGESKWVFESCDPASRIINPTDSRFFWLALYVQPVLWFVMAVLVLVRLQFLWLPLVGTSCLFPVYLSAQSHGVQAHARPLRRVLNRKRRGSKALTRPTQSSPLSSPS